MLVKRLTSFALAGAAAAAAWASLVERNMFTVRDLTVPLVPAGTQPIRVLHISDTHLSPLQERKIEWLRSLAKLRPDAVVCTGDLLGHRDAIPALVRALTPLAELEIPLLFVHGSNDYYSPVLKNPAKYLQPPTRKATRTPDLNTAELTRQLIALGGIDLNNRAARVTIAGHDTVWMGLNDPHVRFDRPEEMAAELSALEDISDALRFGVVHAPYQQSLNTLVDHGAQHIFAGHTHGGQLCLPGVGALTSNSDLPNSQASGLSVWYTAHGAASLNVSAGLGTSRFAPARFACRPEAPLVTFETVDSAS